MGRIWSVVSQSYKSLRADKNGYLMTDLIAKNGKQKTEKVHRLVALAFIPNPEDKPQVNHKSEDKADNRVENLEWATAKENVNYGTRNERHSKSMSKPVYCVELDKTFYGASAAARALGLDKSGISKCCRGVQNTCGGYHWKLAEGGAASASDTSKS